MGAVGLDCGDVEFFNLDSNRLQNDLFFLSRQFVGGDSVYFLGREWWRHLRDEAAEFGSEFLEIVQAGAGGANFAQRFTIGVISIGGKAEADHAFVGFLGSGVELRQSGERSGDEWEDAGGKRIERAEMADRTLLENAAHAVDYVVGGPTGGLVDDDDAIHGEIW